MATIIKKLLRTYRAGAQVLHDQAPAMLVLCTFDQVHNVVVLEHTHDFDLVGLPQLRILVHVSSAIKLRKWQLTYQ